MAHVCVPGALDVTAPAPALLIQTLLGSESESDTTHYTSARGVVPSRATVIKRYTLTSTRRRRE